MSTNTSLVSAITSKAVSIVWASSSINIFFAFR